MLFSSVFTELFDFMLFALTVVLFANVIINFSQQEDEFHRYCKPLEKQILSEFCQNLTGITQQMVSSSKPFSDVLTEFNEWLTKHHLGTDKTFIIATDG